MRPKRLLWLTPVPLEGAGSRFRIYQFLPGLEAAGIHCDVRPFLDSGFFRVVYRRGRALEKMARFLRASLSRAADVARMGRYDALVVYRETFPFGRALIEQWAKRRGLALVYDLDDAVYLRDEVTMNPLVWRLKRPERVWDVIRWSDLVVCGSEYLASRCRPLNETVVTLPTSVDLRAFGVRSPHRASADGTVVAWVGTHSSAMLYLDLLREPLRRLSRAHPVVFDVVGAGVPPAWPDVRVRSREWRLEEEVGYFRGADVGVYPLRDDEWGRGKCAFKAIQFMAVGVPVVASAVGANLELIRDGENGFLARTDQEWEEKLGRLIADPWLRQRMGEAARKTVEDRYSLQVVGPRLVAALGDVLDR
jgi:glycosyltransferase involved in cell wall biosynthesis